MVLPLHGLGKIPITSYCYIVIAKPIEANAATISTNSTIAALSLIVLRIKGYINKTYLNDEKLFPGSPE